MRRSRVRISVGPFYLCNFFDRLFWNSLIFWNFYTPRTPCLKIVDKNLFLWFTEWVMLLLIDRKFDRGDFFSGNWFYHWGVYYGILRNQNASNLNLSSRLKNSRRSSVKIYQRKTITSLITPIREKNSFFQMEIDSKNF